MAEEEKKQYEYYYCGPVHWDGSYMGIRSCSTLAPNVNVAKNRIKWILANKLKCAKANLIEISESPYHLMLESDRKEDCHQLDVFDVYGTHCI